MERLKLNYDFGSDFGKMPPHALELEEVVLGSMLIESNCYYDVIEILKPESFYKKIHQTIFKAIIELKNTNKAVDILTVTEQLRKMNTLEEVGGPFYITQLIGRIGTTAHVKDHARIVAQKYLQRELIRISIEIQNKAYDDSIDIEDLLEFTENEILKLNQETVHNDAVSVGKAMSNTINEIVEVSKNKDKLLGVPSGLTKLDRKTNGWQKSELTILAARPSMGKTAIALNFIKSSAEMNYPTVMFSLEMSINQLCLRMISGEVEIEPDILRSGRLEDHQWEKVAYNSYKFDKMPLYIDDTPALSIFQFRSKARRYKIKYGVKLIIIDYLQLMRGDKHKGQNREEEISFISRSLKQTAKELDVPIIALSQLNREVEKRSGAKRPMLADLRESGAIEQDADLVIFIYRAEKYGIENYENGDSSKGKGELIIAKHRNGEVCWVPFYYKSESMNKITDYKENEWPAPEGDKIQNNPFEPIKEQDRDPF